MISNTALAIFIVILASIALFWTWSIRTRKKRELLHRLFLLFSLAYGSWIVPLVIMRFADGSNQNLMFILDCMMQPGGALCSPLYLCIAVSFVKSNQKLYRWMQLLFVIPALTVVLACTNNLHHLYYVNFSVIKSEIVFGPYILVTGVFNYLCLGGAIVYMLRFGIKNKTALYWKQSITLCLSGLVPLLVSFLATFSKVDVPITATPLSFLATALFNAVAIYHFHTLDITPVATQHILDAISDSYVVLSDTEHVIKFNRSFREQFCKEFGILENSKFSDCVRSSRASQKNVIFRLMAAVDSSRQGKTLVSYEQTITFTEGGTAKLHYFVVDVSPLIMNNQITGYVILFKDITQLRESMKRLQASQERMMEQERFAFLGQMIGGLAHNLKTPIMSISGCVSAADALISECEDSIGDSDVTEDDFREIYTEMRDWHSKIQEATAYMSDIITAIKGQAANISTDEESTFTIEEMIKRSTLLMRHELLNSGCQLKLDYDKTQEISLRGDINNLVQVIGNLLSNSIFAQKQTGGGAITLQVYTDQDFLNILVKDTGPGVSEQVFNKLFKSMVTSKGAMGTGLGLYISNAVIRAKFNGEMWCRNRPEGGCTFGIRIPMDIVHVRPAADSRGSNKQ